MAKGPSTLPPKREGAKPRPKRPVDDDIPKCALPSKRRKSVKPKAKAEPEAGAPVDWDPAAEAEAAKRAVLAKVGRKATVPLDPPVDTELREKLDKPSSRRKETVREDLEAGPVGGKLKRRRKVEEPAAAAPSRSLSVLERLKVKRPPMTDQLFADICLLVAEGIPLREICRMEGIPSKSCFYGYLEDHSDETIHAGRVARYARARALGFDELAAETLEIVDDSRNDYIERTVDGETEIVLDRENIARSKLRAEHRLKLLACWDPKRYGAQLKLADPNGERLDRGGMSTSDIAIWVAKIASAVQAEQAPDGRLIEG